ncbi:hypothetical protein V6N12_006370 [Hibiscus sabdariffa]|uniref:MACPF domain-containing protein n=1 Tax=Hibiscus sabdariffa TaxID=183260 RepID=A0ABR2EYL7_9ROSI
MALKMPAPKAAEIAIGSIGRGYDIATDLRLKFCKGNNSKDSCFIEFDEDGNHEIVLPGGISIPNVSKSINCDCDHKGELTRITSDVLSFQQSNSIKDYLCLEQYLRASSIPCLNSLVVGKTMPLKPKHLLLMGCSSPSIQLNWENQKMVLRDHVKKAVPSTWEPAALARFIETYGTHIIVGVKVGGKDVIYIKQQYCSTLQPADIQKILKDMADKRFLDGSGHYIVVSEQAFQSVENEIKGQWLRVAGNNSSSSYAQEEDIISIYKRRGGSANTNLSRHEWLETVRLEPDVISMSFIPITSLLNGVLVTGAQLLLEKYGSKSVLLLQLRFSTVSGNCRAKQSEWDGPFRFPPKSRALSSAQLPHTRPSVHPPQLPHTISSVYPGGPPMPSDTPELLKFVDTAEIKRGPQDLPGAKLDVQKGKIGLRVKYSLLTAVLPPDEILEEH